jgi:hypothetical protein
MSSRYVVLIFFVLLLPVIACGTANPAYQLNNEVREAVYEYERGTRGVVTDLVIHFRRDEPRVRFPGQDQNGGHTVWLYPAGAEEYFATRPRQATYLYIQEIQLNQEQNSAAVKVFRGDGSGYQGWQLVVSRDTDGRWAVTEEVKIRNDSIK